MSHMLHGLFWFFNMSIVHVHDRTADYCTFLYKWSSSKLINVMLITGLICLCFLYLCTFILNTVFRWGKVIRCQTLCVIKYTNFFLIWRSSGHRYDRYFLLWMYRQQFAGKRATVKFCKANVCSKLWHIFSTPYFLVFCCWYIFFRCISLWIISCIYSLFRCFLHVHLLNLWQNKTNSKIYIKL